MAHWVVSLSDGTSAIENRGKFKEGTGKSSSWRKLLKHLEENKLTITGLKIVVKGRHYHLPTLSDDYRFASAKPNNLYYRRKAVGDLMGSKFNPAEQYIGAIAEYDDFIIKLWVNEKTEDSYIQIIEKDD